MMVSASMNAVGAVSAKSSAPSLGSSGASGQDDSEFAQLLGGMGADTAETETPTTSAKSAKSGADAVATPTDAGNLAAEMLALCGVPMVAPVPSAAPVFVPAFIATDAAASQVTLSPSIATSTAMDAVVTNTAAGPTSTANAAANFAAQGAVSSLTAQPDIATTAKPTATASTEVASTISAKQPVLASELTVAADPTTDGSAPSANVTAQDMQWLRAGSEGSGKAANVMKQGLDIKPVSAKGASLTASATADSIDVVTQPSDGSSVSSEGQVAYQQLLASTGAVVAAAVGQRHESEIDDAGSETSNVKLDVMTMNNQPAQIAGTQPIADSQGIDNLPRHQLHTSVGSQQWASELGNKLTTLATQGSQSATLYMTPADLGPVQVRIDLHHDQASVWFTAEHADTRSALEQSLPRLREMFTAQGMSLTDAGVFGDRSRQQPNYNGATPRVSTGAHFSTEDSAQDTSLVRSLGLSMLDAYA